MESYSSHPTLISTTEHVRRQQKPLFYYSGWLYDDFYTRDHLNALHAACTPLWTFVCSSLHTDEEQQSL